MFLVGLNKFKPRISVSTIVAVISIIGSFILQIAFAYSIILFSNFQQTQRSEVNAPTTKKQEFYINIGETKINESVVSLSQQFNFPLSHILIQDNDYSDYDFLSNALNFIDMFGLISPVLVLPNNIIELLEVEDTTAFLAQKLYSINANEPIIHFVLGLFVIFCLYVCCRFVEMRTIDDFHIESEEEDQQLPASFQILSVYIMFKMVRAFYQPFYSNGKKSVVFHNDCKVMLLGYDILSALKNYVNATDITFSSSRIYNSYYEDTPLLSDRIEKLYGCW